MHRTILAVLILSTRPLCALPSQEAPTDSTQARSPPRGSCPKCLLNIESSLRLIHLSKQGGKPILLCCSSRRRVLIKSTSPHVAKVQLPIRLPSLSTRPMPRNHFIYLTITWSIVGAVSTISCVIAVSSIENWVSTGLSVGLTKESNIEMHHASLLLGLCGGDLKSCGIGMLHEHSSSSFCSTSLPPSSNLNATDGNCVISAIGSILRLLSAVHSKSSTMI
mmetsp:Transcript_11922/g.25810  ORF Transcript_11922/g.25810 Transcript_11922/m.25810 type:complete len:221 (-) Transcript_11922:725-1387(-)